MKCSITTIPWWRGTQLEHHTIPVWQEQLYDAAGIHIGINDLLKNNLPTKSKDAICNDIINITLRCHNIATILMSVITYNTQTSFQLIRNLNGIFHGHVFLWL